MKVKIGTIQVTPDHVAMFTEVLDRYIEAEEIAEWIKKHTRET